MKHITIWLVGFGAVWYVIHQWFGIIPHDDYTVSFVIFARSPERIRWEYADILWESVIVSYDANTPDVSLLQSRVGKIDYLINTSIPQLNLAIMQMNSVLGGVYIDMASMADQQTLVSKQFPQQQEHELYQHSNLLWLINAGISPGITECLIAQMTRHESSVQSISIHLQEHSETDVLLPSWSPKTAAEEMLTPPILIQQGIITTLTPFARSSKQTLSMDGLTQTTIRHYPIFQEELVSIYRSFPQIQNLSMWTGWWEVQQFKTLYDFGLLWDPHSVEIITRHIPHTASVSDVLQAQNTDRVDAMYFGALIDVVGAQSHIHCQLGFDYTTRRGLSATPCQWSTYVSYPTGMWVVSMIHAFVIHPRDISGVSNVLEYAISHPEWCDCVVDTIQQAGIRIQIS